jgi:hypothetical protein
MVRVKTKSHLTVLARATIVPCVACIAYAIRLSKQVCSLRLCWRTRMCRTCVTNTVSCQKSVLLTLWADETFSFICVAVRCTTFGVRTLRTIILIRPVGTRCAFAVGQGIASLRRPAINGTLLAGNRPWTVSFQKRQTKGSALATKYHTKNRKYVNLVQRCTCPPCMPCRYRFPLPPCTCPPRMPRTPRRRPP